jgi:hypothetical protein
MQGMFPYPSRYHDKQYITATLIKEKLSLHLHLYSSYLKSQQESGIPISYADKSLQKSALQAQTNLNKYLERTIIDEPLDELSSKKIIDDAIDYNDKLSNRLASAQNKEKKPHKSRSVLWSDDFIDNQSTLVEIFEVNNNIDYVVDNVWASLESRGLVVPINDDQQTTQAKYSLAPNLSNTSYGSKTPDNLEYVDEVIQLLNPHEKDLPQVQEILNFCSNIKQELSTKGYIVDTNQDNLNEDLTDLLNKELNFYNAWIKYIFNTNKDKNKLEKLTDLSTNAKSIAANLEKNISLENLNNLSQILTKMHNEIFKEPLLYPA